MSDTIHGGKIVRLEAENVKRLSAVEIRPTGAMVVIGGKNAAGKSSVLDAIMYALGGKGAVPSQPIRRGEKTARVEVELDDLIVVRSFTAAGSHLKVRAKDGAEYPSPQRMLDKLIGSLSFDPIGFARMKPLEQHEQLRKMTGLDFSALDARRRDLFDRRTDAGRSGKAMASAVESMPYYPDAPESPVDTAALVAEERAVRARIAENEAARAAARRVAQDRQMTSARVERLESEIKECRTLLAEQDRVAHQLAAAAAAMEDGDPAPVIARLAAAGDINGQIKANAARVAKSAELDRARAVYAELTASIDAVDAEKRASLDAVTFPLPGLSLGDDGVMLDGLPLEQASSAQMLRVSVAIGLALNPSLRVLLVRDGSLLDEDSLRMLGEMATEAGAQVWVERVSEGAEVSVIIEDGAVKS